MAKRDEQQRKLELLGQLAAQRSQISRKRSQLNAQIANTKEGIKDKINVPKRIKNNIRNSFSGSPTKWFLGSAVGGLLVTKILFGRKRSQVKASAEKAIPGVPRGIVASALLYFGKPYLKRMLLRQGKSMLLKKFMPGQQQQMHEYEDTRPYR